MLRFLCALAVWVGLGCDDGASGISIDYLPSMSVVPLRFEFSSTAQTATVAVENHSAGVLLMALPAIDTAAEPSLYTLAYARDPAVEWLPLFEDGEPKLGAPIELRGPARITLRLTRASTVLPDAVVRLETNDGAWPVVELGVVSMEPE